MRNGFPAGDTTVGQTSLQLMAAATHSNTPFRQKPLYRAVAETLEQDEYISTAMENSGMDRFNTLTSSLLVAIVSYLPFKEAVRTSVLSKQWRSVWRETSNLEFSEDDFVNHGEPEEKQMIQRNNFVEFVGNILQSYPRKGVQRFTLSCSKPDNFITQIRNFAGFAVSHNVKEFELDFSNPHWNGSDDEEHKPVLVLPLQPTWYNGIESLKLFVCNFDASLVTKFSVLKDISLGWIEIKTETVKAMLSHCPLLESLSLKKCWGLQDLEICIPDSRLKKLVIENCKFVQDYFNIDGPKLKYLKYSGRIGQFYMYNQRELVEVDLDYGMEPEFEEIGNLLNDFVQELYAAQVLTVCSVFLQMIPQGDEPIRLSSNLDVRHLILKTSMHSNEYIGMKFMLNSCPKLQILTFEIAQGQIFSDYEAPYRMNAEEFWLKNNSVVEKSIKGSLKVVNVKGFIGSKSELYILRYIMYYGRKLAQVNLYLSEEEDRAVLLANVEVVASFKRGSHNLRLFYF